MREPLNTFQLDELETMLKDAGIRYFREDTGCTWYEHHEIYYPNLEIHLCDAVISTSSYGSDQGLLEMMGLLPDDAKDFIEGWLDAKTIFNRIKAHWDTEGARRWARRKS